jgi:RNA polymerase sigma-70 factor, ECF subfamily
MDVSGREERFEALYARYYGRVLAYALRRAPAAMAQDVVADTFVVAWKRLDRLPSEPLPWLLAVARKVMANDRRRVRRQQETLVRLQTPGAGQQQPAVDLGELEAVAAALGRLSELDQELLKLVTWDGLSTKEAATVTGISHVACRVRLHRARRRLEADLAQPAAQPPFRITEELNP